MKHTLIHKFLSYTKAEIKGLTVFIVVKGEKNSKFHRDLDLAVTMPTEEILIMKTLFGSPVI